MSTQAEKLQRFAALTNRLGWDLCIEYDDKGPKFHQEGHVLSPVGITSTIAMLASGADPEDAATLCQRIGIDGTEDLELVGTVLKDLSCIPKSMAFLLSTAWFTNNNALLDSDYGTAIRKFRASIISQDKSKPTLASQINDWVKEEFPVFPHVMCSVEDSSNWHTVIGNVLTFTASWESDFDPAKTCKMPFASDKWVEVDALVRQNECLLVADHEKFTAVTLPYSHSPPHEWWFTAVKSKVDELDWKDFPETLKGSQSMFKRIMIGECMLPKFKVQTNHSIKPMLENLGISLSGKLPDLGEVYQNLDEILHSVYFEVNEGGAASPDQAGAFKVDDVDVSWKKLRFDEQFMFTVHNKKLNIAVLMGFYAGPPGDNQARPMPLFRTGYTLPGGREK
ncbi:Serpin domain-containing protein [Aspergillus venezuelensis]